MPTTSINRTQNWLIAILFTTTLVCVGVVISLLNGKFNRTNQNAQIVSSEAKTAVMPVSQITHSTPNNAPLSEQAIRTTASQLLPAQRIKQVAKVNYEGQLAYQIVTDQAQLYLNAHTGNVISIVPLAPAVQTVQVAYQPNQHESEEHGEHGEHFEQGEHEGEHDDD